MTDHEQLMRAALALARRGYGLTSPNPMVGAVLFRNRRIIGKGWHRAAGLPHAEIEALRDAGSRGHSVRGASLYVTLEPCCTQGRTPPCTEAIRRSGVREVIVAAADPNPAHSGRGIRLLRRAGISVRTGILEDEATGINEAFNHWIVHRTPLVTVKAAMTLDGKIATAGGESKWITGGKARAFSMRLRRGADAILVGIRTILLDDPRLTWRPASREAPPARPRRIILDPAARTPLTARVASDEIARLTTVVVGSRAPARRTSALSRRVNVWRAPEQNGRIQLKWLLEKLGHENVNHLLVEGGGETNAVFLEQHLAHRIAFFYAPRILGGARARKAVAGEGARDWADILSLEQLQWRALGPDLLLTARCAVCRTLARDVPVHP